MQIVDTVTKCDMVEKKKKEKSIGLEAPGVDYKSRDNRFLPSSLP